MVKSKTSKMHLEVNNDVEFDIRSESTSKRNRKSKKAKSTRRGKMPSIIVNRKRIPLKSRNMSASAGPKKKALKSSMKSVSSSKQMSSGTWVNILPKNPYLAKRGVLEKLILLKSKKDDFWEN